MVEPIYEEEEPSGRETGIQYIPLWRRQEVGRSLSVRRDWNRLVQGVVATL